MAAVCTLYGCEETDRLKLDPALRKDIVTIGGYQYLPLSKVCDAYGFEYDWDTFTRRATLRKDSHYVTAMADSDRIIVDGVEKRLARMIVFNTAALYIPVTLSGQDMVILAAAEDVKSPSRVIAPAAKRSSPKIVILDPGHGGRDVGAIGRYHRLREKDEALDIARKTKSILEAGGLKVIMTRYDDSFVSLPERTGMANRIGADLFVSIHINASRSRFLRGFESYYLSDATDDNARALESLENSSLRLSDDALVEHSSGLDKTLWDMTLTENRIESAMLAEEIARSVRDAVPINSRGVKTAQFYVLKHTDMPSVLIEVCYISNRADETKLKNSKFEDKMASSIADGVLKYLADFDRTEGFTKL